MPKNQGNAAPVLYALARHEYGGPTGPAPGTLALCNANNGAAGTGACVFHNITLGGNSMQCVQLLSYPTPDCYYYGTSPNFQGSLGPTKLGLTSINATTYDSATAAFAAHPGWSFANGLGTVNVGDLVSAWKTFVHAP